MEPCEKDYINNHLYDLTTNTTCNNSLLIFLLEKRLITTEEEERLKNPNLGSIASARELYKVVATRKNGYHTLIEGLHKSGQTGAASILLDAPYGVIPPDILLVEQAELLLDFKVQIWENSYAFKEVFPNFSTACLTEILRDSEINKEFRQLQSISPPLLKLQGYTPPLRPFYIPRSISNRLLLKKELFKCKDVEDVFVFTGIDWNDLTQLITPNLLQSSTSQSWSISCRHIFLEHEDDWNDILKWAKTPVHLINFDGENYVLQNSNRTTDVLLQYSYRTYKLPYVTEDKFVEQILPERNCVLLCDVPGMGKTWLMESFAKKIQSDSTDRIVFFIDLPLLAKHLEEKQWNTYCDNNLALILEYACKSKLATSVLCMTVDEKTPILVFVCDGFDEVMESSVEKTTSFLKDLRSKPNLKLLISCRPHVRKYLETTFELASFDILPLSVEEHLGFLVQHWKGKLKLDEPNVALEEFAIECFISLPILKGDPISKLLGTPLICSLLAVINEEIARRLSTSNGNIEVPEKIIVNSISELYEKFVKFCLRNVPKDQQENIIDRHIYHALQLLFPDVAAAYIISKQLITCDKALVRVGIISQDGQFLHRSFAEYFVSRFFAEFYKDISAFEIDFISRVGGRFAKTVCELDIRWNQCAMLRAEDINYREISRRIEYRAEYPLVLHFVNGEFKKDLNEQAISLSVENLSQTHLKTLKSLIRSSLLKVLSITIYLNLENLLSFYVNLIKILFSTNEEGITFVTKNTIFVFTALSLAAKYGSPETVKLLFSLYDNSEENWLASEIKHYDPNSPNFESPLEIAIERNDIDLVECFYGKVMMIPDRLYRACLSADNFGLTAENDDKILRIMNRVLPEGYEISCFTKEFLGPSSMTFYLQRDEILIKFAYMRRTSLTSLDKMTKVNVTSRYMNIGNDELFIKTLLLLFHKDTLGKSNSTFETGIKNDHHLHELTAEEILSLLNITAVKETLHDQNIITNHDEFANMTGLETLKVLLTICPCFSKCDSGNRNYMHFAVHQNKLDWLGHLIKVGHDVNQQDIHGNTPLLSVSPETELEIVKCLVQNGADVYIVNNNGDNFLHCLLSTAVHFPSGILSAWITFIFEMKYNKLWVMKNCNGLTIISLLAQKYVEEADLVFSMYGECQFMPREVKAALLEKTIWWSNDRNLIKLLVEMFPVSENPYNSETDHLRLLNNSDAFTFNSDTVLQLIDQNEAKETAREVMIFLPLTTAPFQCMENVETLKVLLEIIPQFSCCNHSKENYMSPSVNQGKVEWVKYLISLGHDVNEEDEFGNTPIFNLSEKNTMVLIRLLVDNGANLFHRNRTNWTFAHHFLMLIPKDLAIDWARYMLEIGANDIWHLRWNINCHLGNTAFELISRIIGEDHPTTREVLAVAPFPS